jgi:hypothetical protein
VSCHDCVGKCADDLNAFQRAAAGAPAADSLTKLPRIPAVDSTVASTVAGSAVSDTCTIVYDPSSALNALNTPPGLADGSESAIGESRP